MDAIIEDSMKVANVFDDIELEGKTVLITGATGSIGTYFSQVFDQMGKHGGGHKHLVLTTRSGLFPAPPPPRATVKVGDITDTDFVASLPQADIVIHAAGYGQPDRFLANQLETLETSVSSTIRLLRKTRPGGKFLFLSSSELYSGLEGMHKESEIGSTNPYHPRACYIEGKRAGEAAVFAAREALGLDSKSVRLSLAYGPGTKSGDTKVLNSFIQQALTRGNIELRDKGTARRTYCYISDAVEMMLAVLFRSNQPTTNIGGTSSVDIVGLADLIAGLTGATVTLPTEQESPQTGAPNSVGLDLSAVLKLTKKVSFVPLADGLERTIEWQRAALPKVSAEDF